MQVEMILAQEASNSGFSFVFTGIVYDYSTRDEFPPTEWSLQPVWKLFVIHKYKFQS